MCCYGDTKLCDHTASKHRQWEATPSCVLQAARVYVGGGCLDERLGISTLLMQMFGGNGVRCLHTQDFKIFGTHSRVMR